MRDALKFERREGCQTTAVYFVCPIPAYVKTRIFRPTYEYPTNDLILAKIIILPW